MRVMDVNVDEIYVFEGVKYICRYFVVGLLWR